MDRGEAYRDDMKEGPALIGSLMTWFELINVRQVFDCSDFIDTMKC